MYYIPKFLHANFKRAFFCLFVSSLLILADGSSAQTIPICGHDHCLNYLFGLDNTLQEKSVVYEKYLNHMIQVRKELSNTNTLMPPSGQDEFLIPVVFHVIHEGVNHPTNISYVKIQHQIDVLNEEYGGETQGIDINIRFCLAPDPWPFPNESDQIAWTDDNEPGVMRYENIELSNHLTNIQDEGSLMALTNPDAQTFPFEKYLNIWVVSKINGEEIFGYAPNPLSVEVGEVASGIDGVIIRSDVIGNIDEYDVDMYAYFNHGNILVHEIGHYLRLCHTFWQACSGIELSGNDPEWCLGTGDFVCDTPPEIYVVPNCFSDATVNSCVENYNYSTLSPYLLLNPLVLDGTDAFDHIENFMNYTQEDNCMKSFTYGQRDRMLAYLMDQRSTLVSLENLQNTGVIGGNGCVSNILSAAIYPDSYVHCQTEEFSFETPTGNGFSALNWLWDFGDGSIPQLITTPVINHTYASTGNYVVSLTATNLGNVALTNTISVVVTTCGDIAPYKSNWLFGDFVSIDFSSGIPTPTNRIYEPPIMATGQATVSINDPTTGELLFYSNGFEVWNADNVLISEELIGEALPPTTNVYYNQEFYSNSNKALACIPFPNHPNEYFLIRTREYEVESNPLLVSPNTIFYAHIDMNANNGQGVAAYLGELPHGQAQYVFEGLSVVQHENGIDYWILIPYNIDGSTTPGDYLVYLLSENGFSNKDFTSTQWLDPVNWQPSSLNGIAGDHNKYQNGYCIEMGEDQVIYLSEFNAVTASFQSLSIIPFGLELGNQIVNDFVMSPNGNYIYYSSNADPFIHRIMTTDPFTEEVVLFNDDLIPSFASAIMFEYGPELNGAPVLYAIVSGYTGFYSIQNLDEAVTPNAFPAFYYDQIPYNFEGMRNKSGLPQFVLPPISPAEENELSIHSEVLFGACDFYLFSIPPEFGNYLVEWDFGDGSAAILNQGLVSIEHIFETDGAFEVTATISQNGYNPSSVSTLIFVGDYGPDIIAITDVCPNDPSEVYVTDLGNFTSVIWSLPMEAGSFSGTGNNSTTSFAPVISWTEAGNWTLAFSASNAYGCLYEEEIIFNVIESPVINIVVESPCENECYAAASVTVIDGFGAPVPVTNYVWLNNLAVVVSNSSSVSSLCNENYTLALDISNGCHAHQVFEVTNGDCCPDVIDILFENDCGLYPGSPIQFTCDFVETDATFLWVVNGADIAPMSGENPTGVITDEGNFQTYLFIDSPSCGDLTATETLSLLFDDHLLDVNLSNQTECNNFVNTLATFGNEMSFGQDIIFGNGTNVVSVTITNCNFTLGPNVDIIISENAEVIFNNCTFTSCGSWKGFNVKANSGTGAASGVLKFDPTANDNAPHCTIEYAEQAIKTFDAQIVLPGAVYLPLAAGNIYCNKTKFLNNLNSVCFSRARKTVSPSSPTFRKCSFEVNNTLQEHFPDNDGIYNLFRRHVYYSQVADYDFASCTFSNTMTNQMDNWLNRGNGIVAIASRFKVYAVSNAPQVGYAEGNFNGFDFGIFCGGKKKGSSISVSKQIFTRNHIGTYVADASGSRIFDNTFYVGKNVLSTLNDDDYYGTFPGNDYGLEGPNPISYEGVVVYGGDFIEVAENRFYNTKQNVGGIDDVYFRLGSRIRATNTNDMVVRKNSYSKFDYANLANGDNGNSLTGSGLRYNCNTNTSNHFDFMNSDIDVLAGDARIAVVQNEPINSTHPLTPWPTGNTFTTNDAVVEENQFRNDGEDITEYRYFENAQIQIPEDYTLNQVAVFSTNIQNSCLPKYSTPIIHGHEIVAGIIASAEAQKLMADNFRYLYLLLLDGGSTDELENLVESTWGAQVWSTREQLLAISPFVTESVLKAMLDNTTTYPHAIAFEILLANPDEAKKQKMILYLSQKADPMPQEMIAILELMLSPTTTRTEMQKQLAIKTSTYTSSFSEALFAMLDYEEGEYSDADYMALYDKIKSLNSEYIIVEHLLDEHNILAAQNRLADIPDVINFDRKDEDDYDVFTEWIAFRISLLSSGRDWTSLNSTDIAELDRISGYFDTYAGILAISILNDWNGSNYFVPPGHGAQSTRSLSRSNSELTQFVDVYPNPANFITTIKLKETLPTSIVNELVIDDLLGKEIIRLKINPEMRMYTLNTKGWPSGMYIYHILTPNYALDIHGKFEVQH